MHRNRTWLLDPIELRTQRNRILPIEGGDGSTLSLDFTTGVLDPRLTFTRSTNATFINSSGLVQYAASNQQINSQDQSQSSTWVRQDLNGVDANVGATTDPQGGNTASKLRSAATLQAHLIYSTISTSISSGLAYTFSVYVKKAELKYVALHLASTARYTVVFDLDTGLMTTTNSTGTPLGTAYSSQDAGNGWWRLSATMITQTTTIYPHICLSNSATPTVNASGQPYYTGVLNDGVYTWGAQLNAGSTPLQYIATTTAQKFDQPRFDYDPTSIGTPRGLLIEGTVTNSVFRSQALNTSPWSKAGVVSISETGSDSPANDSTSNVLTWTNSTANGNAWLEQSLTVAGSQPYTWSVWLKQRNNQRVAVYGLTKNSGGTVIGNIETTVNFSVSPPTATNTVTSGYTNVTTPTLTAYPNGWYRMVATGTTPATAATTTFGISNKDAVPSTGTNGCEVWGAQFEGGSGASSYIPTGASAAQRLADSAVMNDIAPLNYSATNGSIYWSGIINKQPTSYTTLVGFMTAIDQPAYETFGNGLNYFTAARGATLNTGGANEVSRTYVLGSLIKYASSVNTLQDPIVAVNLNGSAGSVNKSGTGDLRVATRFVIGRQPSNTYGTEYPSVTIRSIKYWPTSKVAAELAALTA